MKKLNGRSIAAAKGIYLCLLVIYAIFREVLAIQNLVGSSLITYGFFGMGILIIAGGFLTDRAPYLRRSQWLPVAFLVLCVVSTAVNLRYDLMSNVKAIAWMALYFFLLLPGGSDKAAEARNWKWVMWTAVSVLFVLTVVSLPMYFFNVDYTYVKASGFPNNQGFSRQYMRLWGVFNDANTAGVYCLVGICFCVYLFVNTKKLAARILLALAAVNMLLLVVLTNSRTAYVAYVVAAVWAAVYFAVSRKKAGWSKRLAVTAVSVIAVLVVALGAFEVVKNVLPYGKAAVQSVTSETVNASIHGAYDAVFRRSGLNITEGYYVASRPDDPEPPCTEPPCTDPDYTGPTYTEPTEPSAPVVETLDRTDEKQDLSNGRFQKWLEVLEVVRYKPVFGASPRGISAAAKDIVPDSTVAKYGFAAHNSLLEVFAGTGAVGLAMVLALLVWLAWIILRAAFTKPFDKDIMLFSTVLLLMICEMMFISDVFFVLTFGGVVFWMSAGRVITLGKKQEEQPTKE